MFEQLLLRQRAAQNVKQKFENLPTQPKRQLDVLHGKMSMDVNS